MVNNIKYEDHPKHVTTFDFMEPIHYNQAYNMWSDYRPDVSSNVQLPIILLLKGLPELDMDGLKLLNRRDREEAGKEWAISQIEFKLIIGKENKDHLDSAKANCEARTRDFLLRNKKKEGRKIAGVAILLMDLVRFEKIDLGVKSRMPLLFLPCCEFVSCLFFCLVLS